MELLLPFPVDTRVLWSKGLIFFLFFSQMKAEQWKSKLRCEIIDES